MSIKKIRYITSGWAKPTPRSTVHYFRGLTSICGRFSYKEREKSQAMPIDVKICATCRRQIQKEAEKSERYKAAKKKP